MSSKKKWLVAAHVVFGAIWFGTALCMVAIAIFNRHTPQGDALYTVNAVMKLLDDFIIIPAAVLSLLTGGLLCWLTIWGFFKHYWVITKWIMTITLIVFGTIWLGPWLNSATAISDTERLNAFQNPLYAFDVKGMMIGAVIQTLSILAIIIISILKPWGRRILKPQTSADMPVSSES